MEPLLIIIIAGIAIAGAFAGSSSWKEVASKLDLEYTNFFQRQLEGVVDGFGVTVRQQKHHIDIHVRSESIRKTINLSKEGFLSGILGGRDIEIGCPTFDANTFISSYSRNSEAEVSAILDEETRELVSRYVVRAGAKVAGGQITHSKSNSINDAPRIIKGLIKLARHLSMENFEIAGRLAKNALEDPLSSVRLRNLTLLQEQFRSGKEALETSVALLHDANDSIRLAAAMFVGEEGIRVVLDIAQSRDVLIDLRIKALQHLASETRSEELIGISEALLTEKDPRLQRMGIHALGRMQHRPALDSLIALLDSREVPTILEVVKAIESIGDSSAEPALVGLLDRENDRATAAAIDALARIGTITAVEPLHGLTKRLGFKRSARLAIDSIQSRLGDVEAGRLSLAPTIDPEGALSLTGDPEKAGGLSLGEGEE